jgi:hypothetical protein
MASVVNLQEEIHREREHERDLVQLLVDKLPRCWCCEAPAAHMLCDGSDVCRVCLEAGDEMSVEIDYRWERQLKALLAHMEKCW